MKNQNNNENKKRTNNRTGNTKNCGGWENASLYVLKEVTSVQ